MIGEAFSAPYVAPIEVALEDQLPGVWRRLTTEELRPQQPLPGVRAGWRVDLITGDVAYPGIDHFLLLIDDAFPNSQPRVVTPQASGEYSWPHVESGGLLCLKSTKVPKDPGQRFLQHIRWAQELLNFSEEMRRREFEREFFTYWSRKCSNDSRSPTVLSLLTPDGTSREIVAFADIMDKRVIVADDKATLRAWLRNNGKNPSDKQIFPSWLEWLTRPWIPEEFPENGQDVIKILSPEVASRILYPGRHCPVVFGAETATGKVFVATLLRSAKKKDIVKGFRGVSRVPAKLVVDSFAGRPVIRCTVHRVDGSWIHGRDHDPEFSSISKSKVVIIGCGAIGASVARLLAQAGVGGFTLVDSDCLSPPNTSRHVLGQQFLNKKKAVATAEMLEKDFPHIASTVSIPTRFDALSSNQLEKLANSDVIVSAGIDYEGDMQIDRWRRTLPKPPVHVCTWTEEFAIVGHAIALFGQETLSDAFNEEQVRFRLTDWPEESRTSIVVAGCENVFQPHGAIELQYTVNTAAGLVLDVLIGNVATSLRRVWQGDLDEVAKRGGTLLPGSTDSHCVKEYPL